MNSSEMLLIIIPMIKMVISSRQNVLRFSHIWICDPTNVKQALYHCTACLYLYKGLGVMNLSKPLLRERLGLSLVEVFYRVSQ